jgi:hypothetical protein
MKDETNDNLNEEGREKFITIDDIVLKAEHLWQELIDLSQRKHPLSVRRGVKAMQPENKNEVLKTQSKTYFFDIETAQNGTPYLKITESYINSSTKEQTRNTIIVFQDDVFKFSGFVNVMAKKMSS